MSDTGQNLKIGIKMQYNPCILFYTSKVSKSYGSPILLPPGDNPIAVNKYIISVLHMSEVAELSSIIVILS
jgi:hypothetical protein